MYIHQFQGDEEEGEMYESEDQDQQVQQDDDIVLVDSDDDDVSLTLLWRGLTTDHEEGIPVYWGLGIRILRIQRPLLVIHFTYKF